MLVSNNKFHFLINRKLDTFIGYAELFFLLFRNLCLQYKASNLIRNELSRSSSLGEDFLLLCAYILVASKGFNS